MKNIRIASVISRSLVGRIEENLSDMEKWVIHSKKQGAEIICFPEMNVSGYSTRRNAFRHDETRSEKILKMLVDLASRNDMVILAGFAETDKKGNLFASHAVVKPDGGSGLYRKLYLAPPERNIFKPANDIPLFEALGVRFGIQLCYDAHFPELSTYMALNGADIIFVPHASPHGTPEEKYRSWMRHLPARAYDNSLFIAACNQTGDNGKGLEFPGVAVVIDPSGEIVGRSVSGEEGVVVTDLLSDRLRHVRNHRMRYFLPNRRSDLIFF